MKKILFIIIGFVVGCITVITLFSFQTISSSIVNADWSKAVVWLSLFAGALIPILVNHFSIKRQEVIKIKAKIATDRINDIYKAREIIGFMKFTVITEYTDNSIGFEYEQTQQDKSAPTLRTSFVLQTHEVFSDWSIKQKLAFQTLNKLNYSKLDEVLFLCSNYMLNLELLISDIPDVDMPKVGIAVKNDLFLLCDQITYAIDDYFEKELLKLTYRVTVVKKKIVHDDEYLKATNLFKYRTALLQLRH